MALKNNPITRLTNPFVHGRWLLMLWLILLTSQCGVYSFTGLATSAKTIQIDLFFNNTNLSQANLGVMFTNGLKDYFQQNSSLSIITSQADLHLEGTIVEYMLIPQASSVSDANSIPTAKSTRLKIGINVNYIDTTEPNNSFKNKKFSFYEDFSSDDDFTSIQTKLEETIFKRIYLDIYNSTLANW